MGLHSLLTGVELHIPKGVSPTALPLVNSLVDAYLIQDDAGLDLIRLDTSADRITIGDGSAGGWSVAIRGLNGLSIGDAGERMQTTITIPINTNSSFKVTEGANSYIQVDTDGPEAIQFGNAVFDPVYNFLGTGLATFSGAVTITGNLTVNGTTTTLDTTNLLVEDPLIILARNQAGSPTFDIGFIGERGSSTNIGFIYDESLDEFACIDTTDTGTTAGNVTISAYANLHVLNFAIEGATVNINAATTTFNQTQVGNIRFDLASDAVTSAFRIRNNSGADIMAVDGSNQVQFPGTSVRITGASGNLMLNDDVEIFIGTSNDLTIVHDGTDTLLTSTTGDWIFDNTNATGSTIFRLGTNTTATSFEIQSDNLTVLFEVDGSPGSISLGAIITEFTTTDPSAVLRGQIRGNDGFGLDVSITGGESGPASASPGRVGGNLLLNSGTGGAGTGGQIAGAGGSIQMVAAAAGVDGGAGGNDGGFILVTGGAGIAAGDGGAITINPGAAPGAGADGILGLGLQDMASLSIGNAVDNPPVTFFGTGLLTNSMFVQNTGFTTAGEPAVSDANTGRTYYNSDDDEYKVSNSGAAYVSIGGGAGLSEPLGSPRFTETDEDSVATPAANEIKIFANQNSKAPHWINDDGAVFQMVRFPNYQHGSVMPDVNSSIAMASTGLLEFMQYVDSGGSTDERDGDGPKFSQTANTGAGNQATTSGNTFEDCMAGRPMLAIKFEVDSVTAVRLFAGFGGTEADVIDNDNPPSAALGIQFSTDRTDTFWQFMEDTDGTSQTLVASTVTPAVNTIYWVTIEYNSTSSAILRIMDRNFNELDSHEFTTGLPLETENLLVVCGMDNRGAGFKEFATYSIELIMRGQS